MKKENPEGSIEARQNTKRLHNACKVCGQKFSFRQRFIVSSNSILTCNKCKAQYKVHMNMNPGRVGGIGGGLGGACIILGYLIGDRYYLDPVAGLIIGSLLAITITVIIYRYTWKKIELYPV